MVAVQFQMLAGLVLLSWLDVSLCEPCLFRRVRFEDCMWSDKQGSVSPCDFTCISSEDAFVAYEISSLDSPCQTTQAEGMTELPTRCGVASFTIWQQYQQCLVMIQLVIGVESMMFKSDSILLQTPRFAVVFRHQYTQSNQHKVGRSISPSSFRFLASMILQTRA